MISSLVNLLLIHTFPKLNEMFKIRFFSQVITDNVSVYSRIVSFDEADNYLYTEHEFRLKLLNT